MRVIVQDRPGHPDNYGYIVTHLGLNLDELMSQFKQFDNDMFKEYRHQLSIKVNFVSVYHPQSNGTMEMTNGLILSAIKKCLLDEKKGKWAEELPMVVWCHNTTESRVTKFTPFKLMLEKRQ